MAIRGKDTSGREYLVKGNRGQRIVAIDGDKFKFRHCYEMRKGGQGWGLSTKDLGYTVTIRDRHMVCVIR